MAGFSVPSSASSWKAEPACDFALCTYDSRSWGSPFRVPPHHHRRHGAGFLLAKALVAHEVPRDAGDGDGAGRFGKRGQGPVGALVLASDPGENKQGLSCPATDVPMHGTTPRRLVALRVGRRRALLTRTIRCCYYGHTHRDGAILCRFMRKERKLVRKAMTRATRRTNKVRIAKGLEPVFPFRTRGWLTW